MGSVGDVLAQLARVLGGTKTPEHVGDTKTQEQIIGLFEKVGLKPIDLANSLNQEIADRLEDDPFHDPRRDYQIYIAHLSEHGVIYDPCTKRFREADPSPTY